MYKNTGNLKGLRCPKCYENQRFVIQMTMNVVMENDGIDFMGSSQPENDHFPGRVIDEGEGLHDEDPISCHNRTYGGVCGHRGTVREFRDQIYSDDESEDS